MYLTFLKKQRFHGLIFALLAQVIGISKVTVEATMPFKTTWIATVDNITIPTHTIFTHRAGSAGHWRGRGHRPAQ